MTFPVNYIDLLNTMNPVSMEVLEDDDLEQDMMDVDLGDHEGTEYVTFEFSDELYPYNH